jgi:hypothetical protein
VDTLRQVGGAEEYPSDQRQDEGQHRSDGVSPTPIVAGRRALAAQRALDGEQRPLAASPDQEIPRKTFARLDLGARSRTPARSTWSWPP